jgi:hypothetical protein
MALLGGASAQAAPAEPLPFAAYFDIRGGGSTGNEAGTYDGGTDPYTEDWREGVAHVAGRAALGLTPLISAQFDTWTGAWQGHEHDWDDDYGDDEYDYNGSYFGFGGHLTFNMTPNSRWGFLGSVGLSDEYGTYGNIGIEGVHDFENLRLYIQAGFTPAISGQAQTYSSRYTHVTGLATYYFNPDFALTGGVGFSRENADGYVDDDTRWTVRLEKKFASLPMTAYIQYQGLHWNGRDDNPDSWSGTSQAVMIGLRFTAGRQTLRDLDQAVGLVDMNPEFGDVLH